MSSSRSRPRLRLGPVDGHDEDFDPLLGRTARDTAASLPSLVSAPAAAPVPHQAAPSVFDEPEQAGPDGDLPPAPPPVEAPVAPVVPTITWQPISAEIPVRRLPSQPPGKGLFVFRNPWRGGTESAPPSLASRTPQPLQPEKPPESQPEPPPEQVHERQHQPEPESAAAAVPAPAPAPESDDQPALTTTGVSEPIERDGPAGEADTQLAVADPAPAEEAQLDSTDAEPHADTDAPIDVTVPEALPTEAIPAQEPQAVETVRWPFGVGTPEAPATVEPMAATGATNPASADDSPADGQLALPIEPRVAPAVPDQASADTDNSNPDPRPVRTPRTRPPASRRSANRKPAPRRSSRPASADARKAAGLPPLWSLFAASFLAGSATLMTGAALAAPLGGVFQMFSDHLMYLMVLPLVALALWIAARLIVPALLTAVVLLVQGVIVVPSLGHGPAGGDTRTTVGWAALAGSQAALDGALREAERQEARLLLLGNAPDSLLAAPPAGWIIAARPTPGDGAAITILSRGGWRAANVAGEPAMARTEDGAITVIGVNPPAIDGDTRARDAEINRSATRAGLQISPTLAIGSFGVVPWNGAISQFTSYGNLTRVRCGGLFGATQGLLPVDHAFVRGITVTGCRTTGALPGSGHRPIWIRLGAPQATPADETGN